MISKIFGILCVISCISAIYTGNMSDMGLAVIEGTEEATSLIMVLVGVMCLWSGIMKVLEKCGLLDRMTIFLSPLLRLIYPDAYRKKHAMNEIAMSMIANFFGLGNASTAISLNAMLKLQENNDYAQTASADMISFTVLNTCAVNLIPTTLIALRYAADSVDPFEIMIPVWIVSLGSYVFAVLLLKMFALFHKG